MPVRFDKSVFTVLRNVCCLLALLSYLIPCPPVQAEDLMEVYGLALKNDPAYKSAEYTHEASSETLKQAYSGLLPTVNAQGEYIDTTQEILDSENTVYGFGRSSFHTKKYSLSLTQPIFNTTSLMRIHQAKAEVMGAGLEFEAAKQDLILRVAELYMGALSARDKLAFAGAEQAAIERHFELARLRLRMGLAPVTDLYDAKARQASVRAATIEAENEMDDAFEALYEVTGKKIKEIKGLYSEEIAPDTGSKEVSDDSGDQGAAAKGLSRGSARGVVSGGAGALEARKGPVSSVMDRILAWKEAWQKKDIYVYLSFYSHEFESDPLDYIDWITKSKRVFSKPGYISIDISRPNIRLSGERATATFVQRYHSPYLRDTGEKELLWKKEGGLWKIVSEKWTPLPSYTAFTPFEGVMEPGVIKGRRPEPVRRIAEKAEPKKAPKEIIPLVSPDPADVDIWIEAAQKQNPGLGFQRYEVEVARQEVNRRRSAHAPTVDLIARQNWTDTEGSLFGGGSEIESQEVLVQLNVPIFEGCYVCSRTREAIKLLKAAKQDLEKGVRAVKRETRAAYLGVKSAIKRVEALRESLVSQKLALEAKREGFRSGLYTVLAVLDAERDLYESKRDYAQARYDYILNGLRLKESVGTLCMHDISRINEWLGPH